MKPFSIWAHRVGVILLAGMTLASIANAQQFTAGQKVKVKGQIVSRDGELVKIQDGKAGSVETVEITDNTKIERKKGKVIFLRHEDMDVTALVPGLSITAEGVGNANDQLEASKITFSPDEFAVEIAQEQQIIANKSAAGQAQSTADQGVSAASTAQASADQAQASANQAGSTAQAAAAVGALNTAAVQMVNQRVSDLDDYKTVAEAVIYYPSGKYALDAKAKAELDRLAAAALVNRWLYDRDRRLCFQAGDEILQSATQRRSGRRGGTIPSQPGQHSPAADPGTCRIRHHPS